MLKKGTGRAGPLRFLQNGLFGLAQQDIAVEGFQGDLLAAAVDGAENGLVDSHPVVSAVAALVFDGFLALVLQREFEIAVDFALVVDLQLEVGLGRRRAG